ncbi:MAG: sulfatase [Candidatus Solibacter sp.]
MPKDLVRSVASGAWTGTAVWSAYALVEFLFSSVVFRLTRPHATFSSWHWALTAGLLLGYVVAGALCGAAGAVAGWLVRSRALVEVEVAATLSLLAAFGLHLVFNFQSNSPWLMLVTLILGGLLVIPAWRTGTGWLTNYWIVSGLLLGLGQVLALQGMGVASQLGARLGLASLALWVILGGTASAAVLAGRNLRLPVTALRFAAIGGAGILTLASFALGRPAAPSVEAASPAIKQTNRPDIILIVMDTVRADHLSEYGYERNTTPNLKALAADSTVYTNAISASDITLSSHASLFTGMYPSWHGAYCDPRNAAYGRAISERYPIVSELLHGGGYHTRGVAANLYLRADFGLERGFDEFRIPRPVPILAAENGFMLRHGFRRLLSFVFDTAQFDRLYATGQDITALVVSGGAEAGPARPAFTFINYMDAHFPYLPPSPYDARFPGRKPRTTQDDLELQQHALVTGKSDVPGYRLHAVSQYDGGIAYLDWQIGQVTAWLKRRGSYDNTMIIVTSDHGESFGERQRVGHANSPYQNLLHVALLVKYPHQERRGIESRPVSLTGVAPTILEAANIAVPASMQGSSLTRTANREIYSETFPCPVAHSPDCPNGCTARAIFSWPYKFITTSNGRRELFDLDSDPAEASNLYVRQPERAAELSGRLSGWIKAMPQQSSESHTLSPEDLQRLKSLGYVQ